MIAYVEDTSGRELTTHDNGWHCSDRIDLQFGIDTELLVENSLTKIDALIGDLSEFRDRFVEEARLHAEPTFRQTVLDHRAEKLYGWLRSEQDQLGLPAAP